jgi:hypothetical protein
MECTNSRKVATVTLLESVPGGSLLRSNWNSPWYPGTPPTLTFGLAPKLVATPDAKNASPASGTVCPHAAAVTNASAPIRKNVFLEAPLIAAPFPLSQSRLWLLRFS